MALQLWSVDSLVKVFADDIMPGEDEPIVSIEAARNETEAGQLVLRSDSNHLWSVAVTFGTLESASGELPLAGVRARFVGYVPVRVNTHDTPEEELIRTAPDMFPDPLLPQEAGYVRAGECLPIWIDVSIPPDTPPGEYVGPIRIETNQGEAEAEAKLLVTVYPARVPDERTLKVTNWVNWPNIARFHSTQLWSEAYWDLLVAYARNLAAHRQNVLLTPIFELIDFRNDNGRLGLDFTRLDRFVELFKREGVIGYIEGEHLGTRGPGGFWGAPDFVITTFRPQGAGLVREQATVGSKQANAFLAEFLPALQAHLVQRGWINIYFQHLADEPIELNAASYNRLSAAVKRYAPRLRTIEAIICHDLTNDLDIWVPKVQDWHKANDFYRSRVAAGNELWFYTCILRKGDNFQAAGSYATRYLDYHLIKTRLLHWLNFYYDASGYLHWGYNQWAGVPPFVGVEQIFTSDSLMPAGDNCIVYPGNSEPLDSIRFEAMRDGIEDYELLRRLAEVNPEQARSIAAMVIHDFDDYELNPHTFRQARRKLIEAAPS